MKDSVIMDLLLPEVTIEDVFEVEGADYSKRPPRSSLVELHRRILDEAPTWITPKAIWREVDIKGVEGQELYLEDGKILTSDVLTKVAGTAEKLVIYSVTIGEGIEERLSHYQDGGKITEAFALDATGTAYLTKLIYIVQKHLEEIYHGMDMKCTFALGPGHSYWKGLEDLQVLFHFLQAERINLRLNSSNLIMPRKSVAVVMGVGNHIPDTEGKTHCHFCHLQKTCQLSQTKKKSPYNL